MRARDAIAPPPDAHASDADLVRLLDGESAPSLGAAVDVHVAGCAECSARLAMLRARSASLSALLLATDPPTPSLEPVRSPARTIARRAPSLRIAAGLLVAAAGMAAAATPAVRGWIAARTSRGVVARDRVPDARTAPVDAAATGAVIGFVVERAELAVQVMLPQASGVLELRAGEAALANAEVIRGEGEGLVVLPGALQFRNRAGSTASYRVTLPPAVSSVIVRIGSAAPRRVTRATIAKEGSVRLPLAAR